MTSKFLVKFYFTTLLIGMLVTTIISLFTEFNEVTAALFSGDFIGFLSNLLWIFGYGLLIASVSQLAFFVYMFIHPLGLGILGRAWPYVQLLLIFYAIFDLFFLRFNNVGFSVSSVLTYLWIPIFIIIAAVIVAFYKKDENKNLHAQVFIPTLFFMIFMTSITFIPFISVENNTLLYRSLITLVVTNAFQIIMLPKYIEASKEDKQKRGIKTLADRNKEKRAQLKREQQAKHEKQQSQVETRNKMKYKTKVRSAKGDK